VPEQRLPVPISTREVAFFGLQAIIPAFFAIVPLIVFAIGFESPAIAARKLTDGTLVLISFTMLISLSQDLSSAVKPYHREYASKLELLLRIAAIVILAVYTLFQSTSMLVIFKETNSVLSIFQNTSCRELIEPCKKIAFDALDPHRSVHPLDLGLSVFSFVCFFFASVLALRILYVLRPYFIERN
jgi:hypothetical protein